MKQGIWVLLALALGIAAGAFVRAMVPGLAAIAEGVSVVGAIWLDALKMTLVPLIFAVLVASLASLSQTASAGPLAQRTLVTFTVLIIAAGIYSVIVTQGVLSLWPVDPDGARALLAGASKEAIEVPPEPMALSAWLRSLVPTNVVAAAAESAILPVVVFACVFGFALGQLPNGKGKPVQTFFETTADAMIVIVQWVLALAPIGVFGLSLSLGLSTGLSGVGVLAHYVALVSGVTIGVIGIAVLLGLVTSGQPPLVFVRALAPVQVIAASTQSSVASLPAMLQATLGPLGIAPRVAEFVLPLAVAVFRFTSPVANLAVALFVAHVHEIEPSLPQLVAGIAVAFAVSVSSVGLPGQSSFFVSVAPICLALGVPVTLLPLLLAVEVIPDIFRTIGNVTADVSVTAWMGRKPKVVPPSHLP
jgi:proton glutamate symport protein